MTIHIFFIGITICISVIGLMIQAYIPKQNEKTIWVIPVILLVLSATLITTYIYLFKSQSPMELSQLIEFLCIKCIYFVAIFLVSFETLLTLILSICMKISLRKNQEIVPKNNQKIIEELEKKI